MASEDVTPIATDDTPINLDPSEPYAFSDHKFSKTFPSKLVSFRKSPRFTDVIVKSKHIAIPCHKLILSAASPFFEELLLPNEEDDPRDIISLSKTSPEILEAIINYFYTGSIKITSQNVQALTTASHEMQVVPLKEACDQYLADLVQPLNCLGLVKFARTHELTLSAKAATVCMRVMLKDIVQDAPASQYKAFSKEELVELISHDNLDLENDDMVFKLVVRWIEADPSTREQHAEDILDHVRLPLCTVEFLCDVVEDHPLTQSKETQKLIREAKNYKLMPQRRHSMTSNRVNPRNYSAKLVVMGNPEDNESNTLWYLDEREKRWNEFTRVPGENRRHSQACAFGDCIIVTGGLNPLNKSEETAEAWQFSVANKKWKSLPPMLDARAVHCMVSVVGKVFVIGGYGNDSQLSSVECMESTGESWTYMSPMLAPINHPLGIVYKRRIFIFGGLAGSKLTQMYDVNEERWHLKSFMPETCERGSVALCKDHIYILGDEKQVCLSYNADLDLWKVYAGLQIPLLYPAATTWDGKILLGGGAKDKDDPYTDRDKIQEYDPEHGTWSEWKISLPNPMSAHTMFSIHGLVD